MLQSATASDINITRDFYVVDPGTYKRENAFKHSIMFDLFEIVICQRFNSEFCREVKLRTHLFATANRQLLAF